MLPKNAVLLSEDTISPIDKEPLCLGVHCICGWKGKLHELYCDPEETIQNFWCPQCHSHGWLWD